MNRTRKPSFAARMTTTNVLFSRADYDSIRCHMLVKKIILTTIYWKKWLYSQQSVHKNENTLDKTKTRTTKRWRYWKPYAGKNDDIDNADGEVGNYNFNDNNGDEDDELTGMVGALILTIMTNTMMLQRSGHVQNGLLSTAVDRLLTCCCWL